MYSEIIREIRRAMFCAQCNIDDRKEQIEFAIDTVFESHKEWSRETISRTAHDFLEEEYSMDARDAMPVLAHLDVFKDNIVSELTAMGLKEGDSANISEKSKKGHEKINERRRREERYQLELFEALRHVEGVMDSLSIGATFTAVKRTVALLNNYYISNSVIGFKARNKGRGAGPIERCRGAREFRLFCKLRAKNTGMSNNEIYIEICKKQAEEWWPRKYDKIRQRINAHKEDFDKVKHHCGVTSGMCDFRCLGSEFDGC